MSKEPGVAARNEDGAPDPRLLIDISSPRDVDPTRIGVDPAAQDILPGGELPEYQPRHVDVAVRSAIDAAMDGNGPWLVIVSGPSKAGKSRTLFEALCDCAKRTQIRVIAPRSGADVRSLLTPGEKLARPKGVPVVWLDDIESFVTEEVTWNTLSDWHKQDGVVVVGIYGGKGSERWQGGATVELAVPVDALLQHAAEVPLAKTSGAELKRLTSQLDESVATAVERYGLAAYMVAGPTIERKLFTHRHAAGEPECFEGVAVVNAVVDWARVGRTDAISRETLRRLWPGYLPAAIQASDQGFNAGIEWALRPVAGSISLIGGSYRAYDFVVTLVRERPDAPDPSDLAWRAALDTDDPGQAFSLGVTAAGADRPTDAVAAFRIAATGRSSDFSGFSSFNLGKLLAEQGDPANATEAYRRAIDSGHSDLGPRAAFNLGILLAELGDSAGAREAYRRAIDSGHPNLGPRAAVNLGILLAEQEDPAGAREAYRRAIDSEDPEEAPRAAVNLGILLAEQGDPAAAREAYRRAIASEDPEEAPRAAFNLGILLAEQGDPAGAREAYRRAIDSGHSDLGPMAAVNLGLLLAELGDPAGAREAFERAIGSGHSDMEPMAAVNLGVLLAELGDPAGAQEAYQRAIGSGHPDLGPRAAVNVGILLAEHGDPAGAREAFQRAIDSGHSDLGPRAAFNLGLLLAALGDPAGAREAYQRAIDSGHTEVGPQAARAQEAL